MGKKITISVLMLFVIASATALASDTLKYKGMPVRELVWNGKSIRSNDVPVVVMDGRTMIPANMLRSVGYTVTSSDNKIMVVPARNKNYMNNIGILTSVNRLFTGLRELEGKLLIITTEQNSGENANHEMIAEINDSMAYWEQEYSEKVNLLNDLTPIDDYPGDVYRGSEETLNLYRQSVESWTKYAASDSQEDLNTFLKLIKKARQQLKSTQESVDAYLNKNFVRLKP